jgi:acetyl-CoA synthetase
MSVLAPKKTGLDGEVYYPSPEAVVQSYVSDWAATAARADREKAGYWAGRANELEWYRKWDTVLDESNKPFIPL